MVGRGERWDGSRFRLAHSLGFGGWVGFGAAQLQHGYTESYRLLSDLGFENVIYDRWNIYKTIVVDAYPQIHESLKRIQALISAELEN